MRAPNGVYFSENYERGMRYVREPMNPLSGQVSQLFANLLVLTTPRQTFVKDQREGSGPSVHEVHNLARKDVFRCSP